MSKTRKPSSLRDYIERIQWEALLTRGNTPKLADDEISVNFTYKSRNSKLNNECCDWLRIRIGNEIMKQLSWSFGDRIHLAHDPDDHFMFLLCRVDSMNGFKLGNDSGSPAGRLQLAWRNNYTPIKESFSENVEYETYKDKLIFRVNVP